eukprot:g970.t1
MSQRAKTKGNKHRRDNNNSFSVEKGKKRAGSARKRKTFSKRNSKMARGETLNEKRHSVEDDTSGTDKVASDVNQNSGNFSPGKVSADSTALSNIGGNAQGSMYNVYINTGVALIAIITVATIIAVCALKEDKATATVVNVLHVWSYSWMTAVCTGLGALPFFLIDKVNDFWLGICNAVAGGMMIAASLILIYEALLSDSHDNEPAGEDNHFNFVLIKVLFGFLFGVSFVRFCRFRLAKYEDLKMGNIDGLEARKILLVVGVMTIHSLSEGVGIGVAFSGQAGLRLGSLVSSSLAVSIVSAKYLTLSLSN